VGQWRRDMVFVKWAEEGGRRKVGRKSQSERWRRGGRAKWREMSLTWRRVTGLGCG
jgi:hypothetical protein